MLDNYFMHRNDISATCKLVNSLNSMSKKGGILMEGKEKKKQSKRGQRNIIKNNEKSEKPLRLLIGREPHGN
jgi:hypothetical protein